jgi:hypothetical protein
MVNRPKDIGTRGETAIVKYARANGFPDADRLTLTGNRDRGDVALDRFTMIEVKTGQHAQSASAGQIDKWVAETMREREHGGWRNAFLVTQRRGFGLLTPGSWWAWWWPEGWTDLGPPFRMALSLDDALKTIATIRSFRDRLDQYQRVVEHNQNR